jgi:predicted acylesterase/phospholipase RssA
VLRRHLRLTPSDRTTVALTGLTALLAISFGVQDGWSGAGVALLIGCGLVAIRTSYRLVHRGILVSSPLFLVLPVVAWFWFVGNAHWITDGLALLAGVGMALLVFMIRGWILQGRRPHSASADSAKRTGPDDDEDELYEWLVKMSWFEELLFSGRARHYYAFVAVTLAMAWLLVTGLDTARSAHYRQELSRRTRVPGVLDSHAPRLGLALSGGGYRAALVHAGVLSALDEMAARRDSSFRIDVISTVSGGSIIGAFYATGHRPEEFRDLMIDRAFNLKRSLLHTGNLIHLLATSRVIGTNRTLAPIADFTRLDVQARQLDGLFLRGATFGDTLLMRRDMPELMLGTTDIVGGDMIGVTTHGLVIEPIVPSTRRTTFAEPPNRNPRLGPGTVYRPSSDLDFPSGAQLSRLVAASGAFPGAFPPLLVEHQFHHTFEHSPARDDTVRLLLADGGIGDNLGLSLLRAAARLASDTNDLRRWKVDLVIASDASAYSSTRIPTSALQSVGRAIDVVYLATGGDNPLLTRSMAFAPTPTLLLSPRDFTSRLPDARDALGSATQLPFGTELVLPAAARDRCGNMSPSPTWRMNGFGRNTLEGIVRSMPVADRDSARRAIGELVRVGVLADTGWKTTSVIPTAAEAMLARTLRREIERKTRTFGSTSTLDDQLSRKTVEDLYALGRYLVLMNRPYIDYWLTRARLHCG